MSFRKRGLSLCMAALVAGLSACGAPVEQTGQPSGSVMPEGTKRVEYSGPILPLTAAAVPEGLTVQRELELDFSRWSADIGVAEVRDLYTLRNDSGEDQSVTLCYPISTSLEEWEDTGPSLLLDGQPLDFVVRMGASMAGEDRFELYRDDPPEVEELYQILETCYFPEQVLTQPKELSGVLAYRYHIGNIRWSSIFPMPKEASLCLEFLWDGQSFSLITEGFDRSSSESFGRGERRKRLMLRASGAGEHSLTLMGAPLEEYTLDGYKTAWCEDGTELPKLTASLEMEELPLSQILEECVDRWMEENQGPEDRGLLIQGTGEYLSMLEALPDGEYLHSHRWENLIRGAACQERIFWLVAEVPVPAGAERVLTAQFSHLGGRETDGPGAREGQWHYDLLPEYGTCLAMREQTVSFVGAEQFRIQSQALNLTQGAISLSDQEYAHITVGGKAA